MALHSVHYPVTDLDAAKKVFTGLLGSEPHTDSPYYVGYHLAGIEVALNPNGAAAGLTGPTAFWGVPDINDAVAGLTAAGATLKQEPKDVGAGTITAILADADGNAIGLIQM